MGLYKQKPFIIKMIVGLICVASIATIMLLIRSDEHEYLDTVGNPVANEPTFIAIEAGVRHTIALRSDGIVFAWGDNRDGRLGNGTAEIQRMPAQVNGLENIISIAAGGFHNVALRDDGTVWKWGWYGTVTGDGLFPVPVQVSNLDDVAAIAAGTNHSIALRSDGTVWSWHCAFGMGLESSDSSVIARNLGFENITAIAARSDSSIVLCDDGMVWILNARASIHNATQIFSNLTESPDVYNIVNVAFSTRHAIAILEDGTVWAWGSDDSPNNIYVYRQILELHNAVAIDSEGFWGDTLALKNDGSVWVWGSTWPTFVSTFIQAYDFGTAIAVAAGRGHSAVICANGLIWAWGNNDYGQLGDGTLRSQTAPVQAVFRAAENFTNETASLFNLDGSINFSQVAVPYLDRTFGRLFDPIGDIEWAFEELFAYADNVVIVHVENIDRLVPPRTHSHLALPQLRIIYSFKGTLQENDRVLLHEPIRRSGQDRRRTGYGWHTLEQDMILVLFLRDIDIPTEVDNLPLDGLPLHSVTNWIPYNFFFDNHGNLTNASDIVSFADTVAMLNAIASDPNRGIRPSVPTQHDDIIIFMRGMPFGAWSQNGWRSAEDLTLYELFSAGQFFVYRHEESTPITQPNAFYARLDTGGLAGYHRGIIQTYATGFHGNNYFRYSLPTAMNSAVRRITFPWDFRIILTEDMVNRSDREFDLLMISSPHNPSPRPINDVPVTSDIENIVRNVLDARGLVNTALNIDYAISVDMHGDGRVQTIIVANTLTDGWHFVITQAEVDAKAFGIYSIILLICDIDVHILSDYYWLYDFTYFPGVFPETDSGWLASGEAAGSYSRRPFFFDVNGDGIFEIITFTGFHEAFDSRLIAYKDGEWVTVLRPYETFLID